MNLVCPALLFTTRFFAVHGWLLLLLQSILSRYREGAWNVCLTLSTQCVPSHLSQKRLSWKKVGGCEQLFLRPTFPFVAHSLTCATLVIQLPANTPRGAGCAAQEWTHCSAPILVMVFLEPHLNCDGCFSSEVMITLEGNIGWDYNWNCNWIKNIKKVRIADQKLYIWMHDIEVYSSTNVYAIHSCTLVQ